MTTHDESHVTVAREIGRKASASNHEGENQYNADDIHTAALVDNPLHAERPSATTILAILFLGQGFVANLSVGFIVITGILTDIGTDLNNLTDVPWIISGWTIGAAVMLPAAGSLQDIFGRRYIILTGQLFSLIGSVVAATAQTLQGVITGSTLLGVACAFAAPYAAVVELVPNKYRALAIAWVEISITLPWAAIGVLIGNLFVLHATWRWPYYICIIYSVLVLAGTACTYFPPARPMNDYDRTTWQQIKRLDFVGYILFTASFTVFLLGLSWAGENGHAWRSASVVAPIVLGAVGFIAAFLYDFLVFNHDKGRALFPKELFQLYREFTITLVSVFVTGMIYNSMAGLIPQATLFIFTNDPVELGVVLLPYGMGQFVASAIVPLFLHRTKKPKVYIVVTLAVQGLFVALYVYGVSFHRAAWMAFTFFGQACFGLITVCTSLNASLHVKQSELGIALGLFGTFRSMGGSVGNVIFNAILRNTVDNDLGPSIAKSAISHGFSGSLAQLIPGVSNYALGIPDAFASIKGVTPAIEQATLLAFRQTYARAFRIVFYSTIPFSVIAVIAAFFIADSSQYMTNHLHVRLTKKALKQVVVQTTTDDFDLEKTEDHE